MTNLNNQKGGTQQMKHFLFIIVVFCFTAPVFGKGDTIPPYKLKGVVKGQLEYRATGNNQWQNKKLPKCTIKGKHYEICPQCNGSGQLMYYIRGSYAGVYDCMKCGPGRRSNSPDGLIVINGEDFSDYYFPASTIADVEIDMSENNNNRITGDINLVSDHGKKIRRGSLAIILGFQYGQTENYINSINFEWTYRGKRGKDRKILNYKSNGTIFRLFDDNQMNLELQIVKYTPKTVKVKLVQKQKEVFPENKKPEVDDKESRRSKIAKEANQAKEIMKRKEKDKIVW